MRGSLTFAAVVVALVSGGCDRSISPAAPSVATATATAVRHDTPFKGRLEGSYTLTFPSPGVLAVSGEGTGNATHLGQFTFTYDELVDLATGTGTGTYQFTAADGDTLTADWTGLGFPTSDPNVLLIVEDATISGGTGRFAGAGGHFRVDRLFNFTTNSGPGSFDGTIRVR